MPRKPLKPCRHQGCPNLSENTYCKEHIKLNNQQYDKHKRRKNSNKIYGRTWREIRDSYTKSHPFCEECYKNGIAIQVDEVHHIIPVSQGGTHGPHNLISLCKSCHTKAHIKLGDRSFGG